jgi:phosphoribosylformimino-5-aminoimidazole carboxamide ribotide isomerase
MKGCINKSMILIPAIDIIGGQAVRLTRGEFNQKTVYPQLPEEYAKKWVNQGAEMLHLVDLEATLKGAPVNHQNVKKIRESVSVKIEIGGGVRSEETFKFWIDEGIDRIVVGTKALEEKFIKSLSKSYADNLVVSLDVKMGKVQTQGWITSTDIDYLELAKRLEDLGVKHFIYTDISKDGALEGPNWGGFEALLKSVSSTVILSGGMSHLDHVRKMTTISYPNFLGAIIGKAIYEGRIDLGKAINLLKESYA